MKIFRFMSNKSVNNFYEQLRKAIEEMQRNTLNDRFEVVLNDNLIKSKEIKTNFRTIMGCRISYEKFEKDISFIVREDDKPTYEQLEEEIKKLKQQNEFLMKQDNILQTLIQWLYSKEIFYERFKDLRTMNTIQSVIDKIKELKEEMK